VHSKVAIIDNLWATVGSANLDGSGLDFFQPGRAVIGDVCNSEVSLVVMDRASVTDPITTTSVDDLRRRLWAEHLGYRAAPAPDVQLDLAHPDLLPANAANWLALWQRKARDKRDGLMNNPAAPLPQRVLPWVRHHHKTAEDYLLHLFADADDVDESVHYIDAFEWGRRALSFDFGAGKWDT